MNLTSCCKQTVIALWLFAFHTMSYADTLPLIKFQSTITPPIWSPDLPNGGIGGEFLALLSQAANVQYQIEYLPLKRFQTSSHPYRVGDPDILAIQKPYAVLPIMSFHSAIFFYQPNHKARTFKGLDDLKGQSLGVLRGTVTDKSYFESHGIQVEESDSIASLLRKLKKGRIKACILVKIAGLEAIKQLFPQEENSFTAISIPKSARPVALIIDQDSAEGKMVAARYLKVLHKTLHSQQYSKILHYYYGDNGLDSNEWIKLMDKYERIYIPSPD